MNIALCSVFRNSVSYLDRYFEQVSTLDRLLAQSDDTLSLVLGEGDSTDNTKVSLLRKYYAYGVHGTIVDVAHGGPAYSSVIDAERFKQLAYIADCVWRQIPADSDAVIWAESDLSFEPATMVALIDRLKDYPAISPMIFLRRTGWGENSWYDTWAGRKNGKHFTHNPPYFDGYSPTEPVQVDSMGSCMAFRGELARQLTWNEKVFPGICEQIYKLGSSVWLDPTVQVTHL